MLLYLNSAFLILSYLKFFHIFFIYINGLGNINVIKYVYYNQHHPFEILKIKKLLD